VPSLTYWTNRALEKQSRATYALVRQIPPRARPSDLWTMQLLNAIGVILLLVLGVVATSPVAWVIFSIPMTVSVLLILASLENPGAFQRGRRSRPA
jgi:peptidoglycan/LPS O-acetylase OafA/YrhL